MPDSAASCLRCSLLVCRKPDRSGSRSYLPFSVGSMQKAWVVSRFLPSADIPLASARPTVSEPHPVNLSTPNDTAPEAAALLPPGAACSRLAPDRAHSADTREALSTASPKTFLVPNSKCFPDHSESFSAETCSLEFRSEHSCSSKNGTS